MNTTYHTAITVFASSLAFLSITGCETNPIKQNAQSTVSRAVNDGVKNAMDSVSRFGSSLTSNSTQSNQNSSQRSENGQPSTNSTQKSSLFSSSQSQDRLIQDCKGVNIELVSLQRSGRGEITVQFFIENTNNQDRALFVFYSGANGNNTFLIDSSGAEWPKKRMDGNGNRRQALISGVELSTV